MDHISSEFSAMTHPFWVALHSMAHDFIELDKAVIYVISLVSTQLWMGLVIEARSDAIKSNIA